MSEKWFEHSYRRNLVDMHINDSDPSYMGRYDPVKYVDNLVAAGIDTAILYAGNCLGICFWPTKAGHMHTGLQGRDIVSEVVTECRRRGLHVNVYFNIWSRWGYDTHPEWRYLDANGKGQLVETSSQRYGLCCPNTGYGAYVLAQVADLSEHYPMDGFWVDMIGWFAGICFCDDCRARYRTETGQEFPERIDWKDPDFRKFQKHREAWFAGFARDIREAVHRFQPEASTTFQAASWSLGWNIALSYDLYRQSDYLAGDFYGDPIEQSFVCKLLDSLTENKPVEFMTSRCPTLYEHTTMKQTELLEAQAFASIANNACFVFIDAMNPDGTVDPAPYPIMGRILKQTAAFERYLGPQLRRQADIAIYTDIHSLASMKDNGMPLAENSTRGIPSQKLIRIAGILVQHNIPYDVATKRDLESLDRFQVIILPDVFLLDQEESAAIRTFVARGGCIYASKDTSLIHGEGDFQLSDVFGVSRKGETDWNITFLAPVRGFSGLAPATKDSPLEVGDTMTLVETAPGAEVLATITLPYTKPFDAFSYSSAISNPPGLATEHPGLVRHAFGKGISVYSAGCFESMPHDVHGAIFASMIRGLMAKTPRFTTDAPRPVEITLYDDPEAHRLVACVLNFQKDLPNIPVFGIHLSISLEGRKIRSVLRMPEKTSIEFHLEAGAVHFIADRLDTFLMYVLSYDQG
jgi:hypothetical protein